MNSDIQIGNSAPLGATVCAEGVNFSVYSRSADRIELLLFDDENGNGSQDTGEAGIAGATVTLNAAAVSVAAARTTVTNADGIYTFTGVPDGRYTLQATLPNGRHSAPITITVSGNGAVTVPAMPLQVGSDLYLPSLQRG